MSELDENLDDKLAEEVDAEAAGRMAKIFGIAGVVLGLLGVIAGAFGFMTANGAKAEVAALEERLAQRPDKTADFEKAFQDLEERLVRLGGELVKLQRADQEMQRNTQGAFGSVTRDVTENRRMINQVVEQMTALTERMETSRAPARSAAAAPAASGGAEASPSAAPAEVAEGGVHLIQSGDTLSKIATQYGVSLSELQRANPTVNPRALQIGQRIVIPQ